MLHVDIGHLVFIHSQDTGPPGGGHFVQRYGGWRDPRTDRLCQGGRLMNRVTRTGFGLLFGLLFGMGLAVGYCFVADCLGHWIVGAVFAVLALGVTLIFLGDLL
jgi:hypothetical protein